MTKENWPSLTEHDPDCDRPGYVWQQPIRPGLPIMGYCQGCDAFRVHRGGGPIPGTRARQINRPAA